MPKAKETIDIEALLEWAFRVQQVDRQAKRLRPQLAMPSISISNGLGECVALGTRVDNSGPAARLAGIRVSDDAAILYDAVVALPEVWIEWRGAGDCVLWTRESAAQAGFVIEGGRYDWRLVEARASGQRELRQAALTCVGLAPFVIRHARLGVRPDWHEGWRRPVGRPMLGCAGRNSGGRRRRTGDDAALLESVVFDRAMYSAWRMGLVVLVEQLSRALDRYDVSGPAAPETPWVRDSRSGKAQKGSKLENYSSHNAMI